MCQPVAHNYKYNADTEPPTEEDKYIDSIADPQLQKQLMWKKYLRYLRNGAWGDHITMQAISDMLSVTINVLSSHYPMYSVTPNNHCAINEVFVGLIMQYHYVGLDKIPVQPVQPVQLDNHTVPEQSVQLEPVHTESVQSEPVSDNELDDATIEAGDEHRRQISGAPQASMMCVENPESFRDIICVAPAEGEKPLNIG